MGRTWRKESRLKTESGSQSHAPSIAHVPGAVVDGPTAVKKSPGHVSALLGGDQVEDSLSLLAKSVADQPMLASSSEITTVAGVPLRRVTTSGLVQGGEARQGGEEPDGAGMPSGLHRWSKSTVELVERACKFVPGWKQARGAHPSNSVKEAFLSLYLHMRVPSPTHLAVCRVRN